MPININPKMPDHIAPVKEFTPGITKIRESRKVMFVIPALLNGIPSMALFKKAHKLSCRNIQSAFVAIT